MDSSHNVSAVSNPRGGAESWLHAGYYTQTHDTTTNSARPKCVCARGLMILSRADQNTAVTDDKGQSSCLMLLPSPQREGPRQKEYRDKNIAAESV